MLNKSKTKTPMTLLPPEGRATSFEEVSLGYTAEEALMEAERCLNCKNTPCVSGCPVRIRIPEFIDKIKQGELDEAYRIISESSSLPAVCGRVCPQETQCEAQCVRGKGGEPVGIGRLERFVADWHAEFGTPISTPIAHNGLRVAVLGSGPAGLSCAGELSRLGYSVDVYEALHALGGVLTYGIPEFRLPKRIVKREIAALEAMGVSFHTNVIAGATLTLEDLEQMGYGAIFIGTGAGLPQFQGIPGENAKGVYSANEYLTRSNLCRAYLDDSQTPIMKGGRVAVIGGGNVAMDASRTALRLGAESVTLLYRRSRDELPARREEVEHAEEEGVELRLLSSPVEILTYGEESEPAKRGFVRGIACMRMELGEPDERGRRRPVPIPDSRFEIEADTVVVAIGTTPNPIIRATSGGVEFTARGGIAVDENGATTRLGVFAGGDAVTGAATVISAMGAGKRAAAAIDEYLKK